MAKKVEVEATEELTQEALVEICNLIEGLIEDIKTLTADKNETIGDFAVRFGIKKKELNAIIRKYLAWKKDRAAFNSEECMIDSLFDLLTGEKCIERIAEADL